MSDDILSKKPPDTANKKASSRVWQAIKAFGGLLLLGVTSFAGYALVSSVRSNENSSSSSTDADSTAVVTTDTEVKGAVSVNTVTPVPDKAVIELDTADAKRVPHKFDTDGLEFPRLQLQGSSSNPDLQLQVGTFNLGECGTASVTDKNISAATSGSDPVGFSYRFYPQNCMVQLVSNPGARVDTVTQTALATEQVQVTQDCELETANTPTLQVIVIYQGTESPRQNITINFIHAPVFIEKQNLPIGENGAVDLRGALAIADTETPTLGIKVDEIQNGEIVSSATRQNMQVLPPQALTQGGVELRSTNSRAPVVTLSAFNRYATSKPRELPLTFYPAPFFTVNNLIVLQGVPFFVTNTTFNVVCVANSFPIILRFSSLKHGMLSHVSASSTPITDVPFAAILQGNQILFTPDGTQNAPSGRVILIAGPATGVATPINVYFDASPYMIHAGGSMKKGGTILFDKNMLWFEDPDFDSNQITIIFSAVEHGTISLRVFQQSALLSGGISATHDGGEIPLRCNVSATDGTITTVPIPMQFTLLPEDESIISGSIATTLITAAAFGVAGLVAWKIRRSCITNPNKSLFSAGTFHDLVCRALFFNRLKFSGCLDFMSEQRTKEFTDAVAVLIDEVVAANNFDIASMPSEKQELLAIRIANKTIEVISPQYGCCGAFARFFKSFCVSDVTPAAIRINAKNIAKAIKDDLAKEAEKRDESVELVVVDDEQEQKSTFNHNPLVGEAKDAQSIIERNQRLCQQAITILQASSSSTNSASVMAISDVVHRQQETLRS